MLEIKKVELRYSLYRRKGNCVFLFLCSKWSVSGCHIGSTLVLRFRYFSWVMGIYHVLLKNWNKDFILSLSDGLYGWQKLIIWQVFRSQRRELWSHKELWWDWTSIYDLRNWSIDVRTKLWNIRFEDHKFSSMFTLVFSNQVHQRLRGIISLVSSNQVYYRLRGIIRVQTVGTRHGPKILNGNLGQ